MPSFFSTGAAVLAAATLSTFARADNCASGAAEIDGNWYCQAVNTIQYTGMGGSGSYNQVTNMNSANGQCSSSPVSYSGSLAPLDEEVSIHFRGPVALKQFAVYIPQSAAASKAKRSVPEHAHAHAHNHAEFHKKRAPDVWVTVTMDGQVVSWINDYDPAGGAATATAAATSAAATSAATTSAAAAVQQTTLATSVKAAATSSVTSIPAAASTVSVVPVANKIAVSNTAKTSSGGWEQVSYYSSEDGTSNGLTFMGNHGGSGSGVWDSAFGQSLAYLSSDATTGASSPQVLQDMTVPSGTEFSIFTDVSCTEASGCGYYRPGSVANHGFDGADKAFLFEFDMPTDNSGSMNADMPAIWLLNAQVPRCGQYVPSECSCWTSGCGEFDIFEVLTTGSQKAKSTAHGNAGMNGGDSDYFDRPNGSTLKLSVVLSNNTATIKVLSSKYLFTSTLTEAAVASLADATTSGVNNGLGVSNFALSS